MKISKNQSSTTWCSLDPYPTPLAYNIFVNCWAGKWRICESLATWESISTRIYDLKLTSKPIEVVVWLSALAYAKESSREMGFQSFVSLQWLTQSKMNNIDHQHLSNIQSTALKCEAWYCLAPTHPAPGELPPRLLVAFNELQQHLSTISLGPTPLPSDAMGHFASFLWLPTCISLVSYNDVRMSC